MTILKHLLFFEEALPTTIYRSLTDMQSLCENPKLTQTITGSEHSSDYVSALLSKVGITDPIKIAGFVVPRMIMIEVAHINSLLTNI